MDGWWIASGWIFFFASVLRAGLENQLPRNIKDTLRVASARLFNLQSKAKRAGSAKSTTTSVTVVQPHAGSFMQYSCAYWKKATTLEVKAQQDKLRLIEETAAAARYACAGYRLWLGRSGVFYGEALQRQRGRRNHFSRTAKWRERCQVSTLISVLGLSRPQRAV